MGYRRRKGGLGILSPNDSRAQALRLRELELQAAFEQHAHDSAQPAFERAQRQLRRSMLGRQRSRMLSATSSSALPALPEGGGDEGGEGGEGGGAEGAARASPMELFALRLTKSRNTLLDLALQRVHDGARQLLIENMERAAAVEGDGFPSSCTFGGPSTCNRALRPAPP